MISMMLNPLNSFLAHDRLMVLDGALATELERRGANLNDALWSAKLLIEQPELIRAVHADYFAAGADVREMADKTGTTIVVTLGAAGVAAAVQGGMLEAQGLKIEPVDTVGAGDTFDAGILASLKMQGLLTKAQVASLTEEQIRKALALGAKAAAVTVSRAGANPPFAHEIGL